VASLGWCLLFLTLSYWWIDVKGHRKNWEFFTIVGMNSVFIYLFFEIVGARWFTGYIDSISNGVLSWFNAADLVKVLAGAVCVFGLEWLMCYFLYRKKIFFKL
jgi:predicted acyltransferase